MILRLLGGVFLVILVAWIVATLLGLMARPTLPRLFGFDAQHAAEYNFSPNAQHQLEQAQAQMDGSNDSYNTFRWISDVASWISFFATSLITIVASGFNFPMPKPAVQDSPQPTSPEGGEKPRPGRFHLLGFLAALASVCTLLAAQSSTKASNTLACSKELRDTIEEVVQDLKDNPQNEFAGLNRLRDATSRTCS
ncbi:hypothetical protein [Mesorhizobium sp. 113-1-2]|uniref:hypothetical protein n=1 Tax=Mesorhizobium sp. 113-1-2 TaxID=2744515 RepID=UPI001927ED83|nr:hypothetical protein [Mesorhizobium sp. 113-1-2]